MAKAEGKTLSAVIQDALRHARMGRRHQELRGIQGYWSRTAREQGILVAALVFPGGRGEEALRRILEEQDELLLSKPILDELLGVLARKFARDAEELSRAAVFLGDLGAIVKPVRRLRVLADAPDNRILECALAGGAGAIVTGGRAMLSLGEYRGVRILALRSYLENP